MRGFKTIFFIVLIALSSGSYGQSTFPDSNQYIPLKFDLGIGNAAQIATVEGTNTSIITQTLEVEGQFSPGQSAKNKGYVKAQGTQFSLNGQPWYCAGTNAYYAALKYIMSDNEVAVMMRVGSLVELYCTLRFIQFLSSLPSLFPTLNFNLDFCGV